TLAEGAVASIVMVGPAARPETIPSSSRSRTHKRFDMDECPIRRAEGHATQILSDRHEAPGFTLVVGCDAAHNPYTNVMRHITAAWLVTSALVGVMVLSAQQPPQPARLTGDA